MKKTIAKIMAAAMILSAVPAVSLTVNAEPVDKTANPAGSIQVDDANYSELGADGFTGYTLSVTPSTAKGSIDDSLAVFAVLPKVADKTYSGVNATASITDKKVNIKVSGDGATIRKMVANSDNKVDLYGYVKADNVEFVSGDWETIGSVKTRDAAKKIGESFVFGEASKNASNIYTEVADVNGLLKSGDIYAELDSSGRATVRRGSAADLDGNDDLRGNTLDLTNILIGGTEYEVRTLASQSLKKAHMKKLVVTNVRKINKGALRKAKQMKTANLGDNKKLRKINSKAFYDCKNLKTLKVDGRKLNEVGRNAFAGTKKGLIIRIKGNKNQRNKATKLLKKGGGSSVKYTNW